MTTNHRPYSRTYQRAMTLATLAHQGQMYTFSDSRDTLISVPYIYHLTQTILMLDQFCWFEMQDNEMDTGRVVAILHDILEDTQTPASTIEKEFGVNVMKDVLALTRRPDQGHDEYLQSIAGKRRIVQTVKLCDRMANMIHFPYHWTCRKIARYIGETEDMTRMYERAPGRLKSLARQKIAEWDEKMALKQDTEEAT